MRIQAQKSGTMTEADRLDIARLLVKAGYTVRIGKEKTSTKANAPYVAFIEYTAPGRKIMRRTRMAKKNFKMTPEERAQHDYAVKVRKMTDKQIWDLLHAPTPEPEPVPAAPSPSEIIKSFIDLCAAKGRRMGPSTICRLKMLAVEAGYDIGV